MTYFVIRNRGGDTHVEEVDEQTLKKRLAEEYYGKVCFMNRIGNTTDTNYWGENILIIKGEIVTPRPVQVVTEYRL